MAVLWWRIALGTLGALLVGSGARSAPVRQAEAVASVWRSTLFEAQDGRVSPEADRPFERADANDSRWTRVTVPHNWQGYAYNRQVVRGARHGVAWYRTHLTLKPARRDERIQLFFEGVNSYASVWLNGRPVGRHAGGLTSFTLDVTGAVRAGDNVLAVRVDNPAGIQDLPWVSGDDQEDGGCCEGSQPFGIFRPVHVVRSAALHIRPFGLYAWGGLADIDEHEARLTLRAEMENRSDRERRFVLLGQMLDQAGKIVAEQRTSLALAAGASREIDRPLPPIARPKLWSPASPTLYMLRARLMEGGRIVDEASTPYGIRTAEIRTAADGTRRLYWNGVPMPVQGIAEYEHLLGGSHAFSAAQAAARIDQVKAAGFNAFRDGHYPHNFAYGDKIARDGLLWWTQFSAHLWFDNPAYRANFRSLMSDWVRERRNNPAVFLWGLQNESRLPEAFAREMTALIRTLDPTASIQRLVTTCNGGKGTDWDVPQNWSGTYGGNPNLYADEVAKQSLIGEYGAWRSLGLHAEAPYADKLFSEDRMAALMQKKARLADTVATRSVGQFHWLLATHENPGRPMRSDGTQIWDGVRELDHVGPANNKGLMTLWGEPLDVYYMFRARQVPRAIAPMVYIVSHSWPDRWTRPGERSGIEVYSNCAEVELFNDPAGRISLGRRRRDAEERFRWDRVPIRYGTLLARCAGETADAAASDSIVLPLLPPAPGTPPVGEGQPAIGQGAAGMTYLYRIRAGGASLTDASGQVWAADRHWTKGSAWGWTSWADAYPELDPALGSRGRSFDAIAGTDTPALLQTYRYGREALRYRFAVPPGRYRVELYFVEPWYGRAGIDARGWRRFDVAIDRRTVIRDLDIFAEAGFATALKKVVTVTSAGGEMEISFPRTEAGQAVISAIAIATDGPATVPPAPPETDLVTGRDLAGAALRTYADIGDGATAAARWAHLPYELLDSDALVPSGRTATVAARVSVMAYLALPPGQNAPSGWAESKLTASLSEKGEERPVRFVVRRLRPGEETALPPGAPALFRRALLSPYAPGQFSFKRDAGLREAEKGAIRGGTVAVANKGYGGQGYVLFGAGPGEIGWTVETDVAGRHGMRLRYWNEGAALSGTLRLTDASGLVIARVPVAFATGEGWQEVAVETPGMVNAGTYKLTLEVARPGGLAIDLLRFE